MLAKFNPTGTHTHKGFLKVRVDLYPEPTDKTYKIHHVQVPVYPPEGYQGKLDDMGSPIDQADYDNWIDSLPKVWQLNPCLCHFIKVKEASTKADLTDYLEQIFTPTVIKTIDDSLILPNSIHLVSPLMRDKASLTSEKIVTKDIGDLVTSVNSRFASLVLEKGSNGKGLDIEPQTIDVGSPAVDRAGILGDYTLIGKTNPANADGTLDTWEVWTQIAADNIDFATFFVVSGNNLSTRDTEAVGASNGNSKTTYVGLSTDVETGDYAGLYHNVSNFSTLDRDNSGGDGMWYISALDKIPCTNQAFSFLASYRISLYATGTEAGGAADELGAFYQRRNPFGLNIQTAGQVRAG